MLTRLGLISICREMLSSKSHSVSHLFDVNVLIDTLLMSEHKNGNSISQLICLIKLFPIKSLTLIFRTFLALFSTLKANGEASSISSTDSGWWEVIEKSISFKQKIGSVNVRQPEQAKISETGDETLKTHELVRQEEQTLQVAGMLSYKTGTKIWLSHQH